VASLGTLTTTSAVHRIHESTVFRLSIAGAILLAGVVVYPLARDSWQGLQSRRSQEREFVAADDLDQQAIARALLIRELALMLPCAPSVACPAPVIHFDRNAATFRPLSGTGEWAVIGAGTGGGRGCSEMARSGRLSRSRT